MAEKVAEFKQDDVTWDVLQLPRAEDETGWNFFIFVPKTKSLCRKRDDGVLYCNKTLNTKSYLDWMVSTKRLKADEWWQVLELGNEVAGDCADP